MFSQFFWRGAGAKFQIILYVSGCLLKIACLRRYGPLATCIHLRMWAKWAKNIDDPRFFIRILKVIC